jgi:hypothetical protein
VAIWWEYRKRSKLQQPHVGPHLLQGNTIGEQSKNVVAKAKADRIERRLLFFAVITFFGHVLITLYLVSQMNIIGILCHFMNYQYIKQGDKLFSQENIHFYSANIMPKYNLLFYSCSKKITQSKSMPILGLVTNAYFLGRNPNKIKLL